MSNYKGQAGVAAGILAVVVAVVAVANIANFQPSGKLVAQESLIFNLKLDEGTGSLPTDSIGGLKVQLSGGPSWTADRNGNAGKALALSSSLKQHAALVLPKSVKSTTSITLSAWVKKGNIQYSGYIIAAEPTGGSDFASGAGLFLDKAGKTPVFTKGSGGSFKSVYSNTQITDDNWHLVTGTYDGSTRKIYLDGIETGKTSDSEGLNWASSGPYSGHYPDPDQLYIGGYRSDSSSFDATSPDQSFFSGSIDDVRIYSKALSAAEVQSLLTETQTSTATASPTTTVTQTPTPSAASTSTTSPATTAASAAPTPTSATTTSTDSDQATSVPLPSPAFYLPFDEGTGPLTFDSAKKYRLDLNAPVWAEGQSGFGKALKFDSSKKDYLSLDGVLAQENLKQPEITLSAWVAGGSGTVVNAQPSAAGQWGLGAYIGVGGGGKPYFTKGSGDGSWETIYSSEKIDTDWHHIAVTYDKTAMRIYVDGKETGSSETQKIDTQGISWEYKKGYPEPEQLYIGAFKTNQEGSGATKPDANFYKGLIDDVRIYTTALTAYQIKALKNLVPSSPTSTHASFSIPLTGGSGMLYPENYAEYDKYKISATTGSNDRWARIEIKDSAGKTLATPTLRDGGPEETFDSLGFSISITGVSAYGNDKLTSVAVIVKPIPKAVPTGTKLTIYPNKPAFYKGYELSAPLGANDVWAKIEIKKQGELQPAFHYKLDETEGITVADSSANSNAGTLESIHPHIKGGFRTQEGKFYSSTVLAFTGFNYVKIPASPALENLKEKYTLSFWFNQTNQFESPQTLLSYAGQYGYSPLLTIYNKGDLGALGGAYAFCLKEATIKPTELYHISLTSDGIVYINGKQTATGCGSIPSLKGLVLGSRGEAYDPHNEKYGQSNAYTLMEPFNGWLDDVRIYGSSLTDEEASQLYSQTELSTAPAFHYKLDETEGITVADSSANSNAGTLVSRHPHIIGTFGGSGKPSRTVLAFTGFNYVKIPASPALENLKEKYTLSFWFNQTNQFGGYQALISSGYQYGYQAMSYITPSGKLYVGQEGTLYGSAESSCPGLTITPHELYHVALTSDGTIYINGEQKATGCKLLPLAMNGLAIGSIGKYDVPREETILLPFKGWVEDVRLYGSILSSKEISQIYSLTPDGILVASGRIDQEKSKDFPDQEFSIKVTKVVASPGGQVSSPQVEIEVFDLTAAPISTCKDSDGGKDYYVKGETYDAGAANPFTDACSSSADLAEHWCGDDGRLKGETYKCPNGCIDGACIKEEVKEDLRSLLKDISKKLDKLGEALDTTAQTAKNTADYCGQVGAQATQNDWNHVQQDIHQIVRKFDQTKSLIAQVKSEVDIEELKILIDRIINELDKLLANLPSVESCKKADGSICPLNKVFTSASGCTCGPDPITKWNSGYCCGSTTATATYYPSGCPNANPNDPIAYWSFDKGTGHEADDSIGNNHGILKGAVQPVDGKVGKAIKFSTKDDYIQFPSELALTDKNTFSVSMWIKTPKVLPTGSEKIMQVQGPDLNGFTYDHATISLDQRGLTLSWLPGSVSNAYSSITYTQPPLDQWVYLTAVWEKVGNNLAVKLYVNGGLASQGSGLLLTSNNNLKSYAFIGRNGWNLGDGYAPTDVLIDEVKIYDKALSSDEVCKLSGRSSCTTSAGTTLSTGGGATCQLLGTSSCPPTQLNTFSYLSPTKISVSSPIGNYVIHTFASLYNIQDYYYFKTGYGNPSSDPAYNPNILLEVIDSEGGRSTVGVHPGESKVIVEKPTGKLVVKAMSIDAQAFDLREDKYVIVAATIEVSFVPEVGPAFTTFTLTPTNPQITYNGYTFTLGRVSQYDNSAASILIKDSNGADIAQPILLLQNAYDYSSQGFSVKIDEIKLDANGLAESVKLSVGPVGSLKTEGVIGQVTDTATSPTPSPSTGGGTGSRTTKIVSKAGSISATEPLIIDDAYGDWYYSLSPSGGPFNFRPTSVFVEVRSVKDGTILERKPIGEGQEALFLGADHRVVVNYVRSSSSTSNFGGGTWYSIYDADITVYYKIYEKPS